MTLSITFLGHSAFLFSDGTHTIAVDPFLTGNPVASIGADDVECSYVGLTHGHADHFGDTEAIAKRTGATVIAAFEIAEFLGERGVENVAGANPGGRVTTDFGWVALTPAIHSSSYEGRYMGMPCGLMINIGGTTIYHLGDTTIFGDMALLGELYEPDIACVPIGDCYTMGPELATRATELIRPTVAIPIHYNTWPPIEQDPAAFRPSGVDVRIMAPGDTWTYAGAAPARS